VPILLEELHDTAVLRQRSGLMVPGASVGVIITPNSPGMAMDLDIEALKAKLAALKTEHRDLDEVIARLAARAPVDQLELQRLKKRKLLLKDQITKIESELLPDIIA
jgi:hypothetical protein